MSIWLVVLGPLIGLAGTVLGFWISHRRWSRQQTQLEQRKFLESRKAAYIDLWDVVETCHVEMRGADKINEPLSFSGLIADVNNFMIRRGLFIETSDRHLVLEYLFWTYEFLRHVAETPQGKAAIAISAEYPAEFPSQIRLLNAVREQADQLRNQLRDRIREVVGGPNLAPRPEGRPPSEELSAKLRELSEQVATRQREIFELEIGPRGIQTRSWASTEDRLSTKDQLPEFPDVSESPDVW